MSETNLRCCGVSSAVLVAVALFYVIPVGAVQALLQVRAVDRIHKAE
jgi:hypothetical protein